MANIVSFKRPQLSPLMVVLDEHITDRAMILMEMGYTFHIDPQPHSMRILISVDRDGEHIALGSAPSPEDIRLVAHDVIQTAWDIHNIGEHHV